MRTLPLPSPATRKTAQGSWTNLFIGTGLSLVLLLGILPAVAHTQDSLADQIVSVLDVRPGMVVADIGAGNGWLALRLAGLVGSGGRVYANEVDAEMIKKIEKRKAESKTSNLDVVLGREIDPDLPGPADRILLIEVYHHLSKRDEFVANTAKYLKTGGMLVVLAIDVRRVKPAPPHVEVCACRSLPAETQDAIEKAGFLLRKMEYVRGYPELYVLFFEKAALPSSRGRDVRPIARPEPRHGG